MGFLKKFKRTEKKEYMKYEDGKVVPVKVEEHKNYKEYKISPIGTQEEEFDIKTVIKEKIDMPGKVKKYSTLKTLKILGVIAVIIFFIFTVKDLYVAFTTPEQPNIVDTPKPTTTPTDTKTTTTSENGLYQSGLGNIDKISLPLEEKQEPTKANTEKSPLKKAVDSTNVINSMLVSETEKEIGYLNQYFDNKINKFSLEKKLKESFETKKQLSLYLTQQRTLFEDEEILNFYTATEERLNNVISLSETIINSIDTLSKKELILKINNFIESEVSLKENQNKEFINLLNNKKIEYTFDKEKGQIKYTLK